MKLLRIESLGELRHCAPAWDDLWRRSDSTLPTHRAELLAQWLEQFAHRRRFTALAVEADGQLVAALPLVAGRKLRVVPTGKRTSNCWSEAGTLLLDSQAPQNCVELLSQGLRALRWPLLTLDAIDVNASSWCELREQLQQAGAPTHIIGQFHNGLIDITHDWDAYVAALSGNHRSAVRRSLKRLRKEGEVELVQHTEFHGRRIESLLHEAFEIEDRSWKGEAGTSILRSPGMFDFFLRQSQQLAEWRQLELLLLKLNGQPIAFEYCYHAKGVIASHKIGYDETFKKFGPGRLLRYLQLERYFADPQRRLFDTMGVLCSSKAKWCTRSYQASRLMIAPGGVIGKTVLAAHHHIWPHVRQLVGRTPEPFSPPPLGAAAALAASPVADGTAVMASV